MEKGRVTMRLTVPQAVNNGEVFEWMRRNAGFSFLSEDLVSTMELPGWLDEGWAKSAELREGLESTTKSRKRPNVRCWACEHPASERRGENGMKDHHGAEALLTELDSILEEVEHAPTISGTKTMCPCRLYWAACEAAEAARIMEIHRRSAGLTAEDLEVLKSYGRVYERAQLMLLEHFPYSHAQVPPPEL